MSATRTSRLQPGEWLSTLRTTTDSCVCGATLLDRVPGANQLPGRIHHAETIALRIGEDYVVRLRRSLAPRHFSGAEGEQTLDLAGLVVRVEVQMYAGRHLHR